MDFDLKSFKNYAVFVNNNFDTIIIKKCRIEKPMVVKCHGVKPNNGPSGVFNCCIGDYREERCEIYIHSENNTTDDSISTDYIFGCHWVANNTYSRTIAKINVNKLIENSNGCYVGFFKTKNSAYKAIIKCRKDYIKRLRYKIKSVVKVKDVVEEFKEAYAKHKQDKILQRTSRRSKKRF